jgi:hypothetical protein
MGKVLVATAAALAYSDGFVVVVVNAAPAVTFSRFVIPVEINKQFHKLIVGDFRARRWNKCSKIRFDFSNRTMLHSMYSIYVFLAYCMSRNVDKIG